MPFICGVGREHGRPEHRHDYVREITAWCWGRDTSPSPMAPVVPPVTYLAPAAHVRMASEKQIRYVHDLGGDAARARRMTYDQCHEYLNQLEGKRSEARVSKSTGIPPEMIALIKTGYYATRVTDDEPLTFYRVSRPKSGKFAGALKIQTQHSDTLKLAYVWWPSGRETVIVPAIKEHLLLLVANQEKAGLLYAIHLGRCRICGKTLTDERSRWYGIGPDCETRHQWAIEEIDLEYGPYAHGRAHARV